MSSKRLRNTDLQKHANIFPKQKFIVEARLGNTIMGSVLIGSVLLGNTSKYNFGFAYQSNALMGNVPNDTTARY